MHEQSVYGGSSVVAILGSLDAYVIVKGYKEHLGNFLKVFVLSIFESAFPYLDSKPLFQLVIILVSIIKHFFINTVSHCIFSKKN